jgi:hypothetical protein
MAYDIKKVDVWAADIPNQSGTLARLIEQLSAAGAQLEFMIARKVDEGTSRVFIAPIKGGKVQKAASAAGLARAGGLFSLRIEGPNKAGLGAKVTKAIAEKGINLRGASGAGLGKTAVFYLAFDNEQDLKLAAQAVRKSLAK